MRFDQQAGMLRDVFRLWLMPLVPSIAEKSQIQAHEEGLARTATQSQLSSGYDERLKA